MAVSTDTDQKNTSDKKSQNKDKTMFDKDALANNLALIADELVGLGKHFSDKREANKEEADAQIENLRNNLPVQPELIAKTLMNLGSDILRHPDKAMAAQTELMKSHVELWQSSMDRLLGKEAEPVISPKPGDRRFKDEDWDNNPLFNFLKQSYLITADWAEKLPNLAEDFDSHEKHKANFYLQQLTNALSPTNFVFTNPEVLRTTMATNGENLVEGVKNLVDDLKKSKQGLKISHTDMEAFKVGENIAATPGKVVFQNRMLQLIQYTPQTEKVYKTPLLIVPPWINKYYILDLSQHNSFVKYAVEQGHTVFMVSWVNPGKEHAGLRYREYIKEGVIEAINAVERATGENKINTIGFCIGGTTLMTALCYMAETGDDRVNSATLFTTQVDFSKAGDMLVFIDEEQVRLTEKKMKDVGFLDGSEMANTFNMLRSNEMVWNYVVNNYMLGKDPFPFDILFWNEDSTRMPATAHAFYLRHFYLNNSLSKGEMEIEHKKMHLGKVKVPIYNLATHLDHIAPMNSVWELQNFVASDVTNVIAGSGHVAGVINPPSKKKYNFHTDGTDYSSPEKWIESARHTEGSWWPHWAEWMVQYGGEKIDARKPGDGDLDVIEDAPGSYVLVQN